MTAVNDTLSQQHLAARDWASRGYFVFPCVSNEKRPLLDAWESAASTDLAVVDAWWRMWPDANVGCAPHRSGHFVVDVDDKKGKHGSETLACIELSEAQLPETLVVNTPSGGRHLWFRGDGPTTTGRLGDGLDTRGRGGYVLMPGSQLGSNAYVTGRSCDPALSPSWLAARLVVQSHERERSTGANTDAEINVVASIAYLHQLVAAGDVAIEGQGGNERTYKLACQLRDKGLSKAKVAEIIAAHWNPACKPPWDMATLVDNNPNPNAAISHAFAHGQNEHGSKASTWDEASIAAMQAQVAAMPPPAPKPKMFTPLTRADLAALKEPQWLIPGWFPRHGVGVWYGAKNSYKSFTVSEAVLGLAAEGKTVVQLIGEGGKFGIRKRVWAWEEARGREMPSTYHPIPRLPTMIERNAGDFIDEIKALGIKPDIITVDTLTRLLTGLDALAFKDMSTAYALLENLANEFNCFVIGIGHAGKDVDRGLIGSVVATANADVVVRVEGDRDNKSASWTCEGMRDAETPEPQHWQGRVISGSLVFDRMSQEQADAKNPNTARSERTEMGAILRQLGAFGLENGKEPQVVAREMVAARVMAGGVQNEENLYNVIVRTLKAKARTTLQAYVLNTSPLLFGLTTNPDETQVPF